MSALAMTRPWIAVQVAAKHQNGSQGHAGKRLQSGWIEDDKPRSIDPIFEKNSPETSQDFGEQLRVWRNHGSANPQCLYLFH
jgi:hypothetical protein